MATFYDDFERANGSLGGNWVDSGGAMSITGGYATATFNGLATNTTIQDSGRNEAEISCGKVTDDSYWALVLVKCPTTSTAGYSMCLEKVGSDQILTLRKGQIWSGTTLDSYNLGAVTAFSWTLKLVYEDGHLSGYYNGDLLVEADDLTYSGGEYCGMGGYTNNTRIAWFRAVGGSAVTFTVDPDVIGNYANTTELTFTGGNTDWTAGTPGSPTFTVNHGTLSDQEVVDETSATATYDPGDYLGLVVFTDPSTGATAEALVTSDPGEVNPPGTAGLTTYAVAMLNNTAGESLLEKLIKPNTEMTVTAGAELEVETILGRVALTTGAKVEPSNVPDAGLLDLLWQLVNGGYDPAVGPFSAPPSTPMAQNIGAILDALETLITVNDYTLGDVITTLAGEGVPTHKDIVDALAGIGGGDNTEVLEAIATLRGDESATVAAVILLIQELSTIAGYDLGDVLTAIAAIPTNPITSLSPVTDKLALIQPSNSITLSSISLDVGSVAGDLADLALEVAAVKEIVEDILAALGSGPAAPVWPGVANVTLGTEVALSNGLEITGPMDGIVLTITSQPVQAGRYRFGSVSSWTHVGAIMFCSDRGDYERPESFSIDTQVVCPRTMQSAASCIIRLNSGWEGTIRPWTRAT